jgi:hypothetical protein
MLSASISSFTTGGYVMKNVIVAFAVVALFCTPAFAKPRRSYTSYSSTPSSSQVSSGETSSAQGVANIMARTGRVGHWGGNSGYEGCGSGSSPDSAYRNCCYANSNMTTVDVGYAQGNNGQWYCCRRYR